MVLNGNVSKGAILLSRLVSPAQPAGCAGKHVAFDAQRSLGTKVEVLQTLPVRGWLSIVTSLQHERTKAIEGRLLGSPASTARSRCHMVV